MGLKNKKEDGCVCKIGLKNKKEDGCVGKREWMIWLPKSVFIVVHPDFEHTSVDPNVAAELVDQLFVPLLHLPPNSLCQFVHPLLLILREFCSEPLPPTGIRSCRAGRGSH
ncbi:unnamed protein product [Camellia sinensis]